MSLVSGDSSPAPPVYEFVTLVNVVCVELKAEIKLINMRQSMKLVL